MRWIAREVTSIIEYTLFGGNYTRLHFHPTKWHFVYVLSRETDFVVEKPRKQKYIKTMDVMCKKKKKKIQGLTEI